MRHLLNKRLVAQCADLERLTLRQVGIEMLYA